jgi:hypothetical protein
MSGKNGSPRHSAPVQGPDASAPQARKHERSDAARVPASEDKRHPAQNKDDPEPQSKMKREPPAQEQSPRQGTLDHSLQAQLGRQLRAIFSDIAEEPVPERFVKLLEALEAKEKRR